jgi:hypothetical protein
LIGIAGSIYSFWGSATKQNIEIKIKSSPGSINTINQIGNNEVNYSASLIEVPKGLLYDQGTREGGIVFTVNHEPSYVIADGVTFFDGVGYKYAASTITMVNPVTQYIRSYYSN